METVVVDVAREPDHPAVGRAAEMLRRSRKAAAFSGAGISVESGIPDFRSPGGLWEVFDPAEYATIEAFERTPEKAWRLFRAMGNTVAAARPNRAHESLAALELAGMLAGVVTQNVDGLHQAAGSRRVIEIHGDHRRLQCLECGRLDPIPADALAGGGVPRCRSCSAPVKPNVVLFGEPVRGQAEIRDLLDGCDLLLVIGTSAMVYPAAGIPAEVKANGGSVLEFNLEPTGLSAGGGGAVSDYLFKGPAGTTVPALAGRALAAPGRERGPGRAPQ